MNLVILYGVEGRVLLDVNALLHIVDFVPAYHVVDAGIRLSVVPVPLLGSGADVNTFPVAVEAAPVNSVIPHGVADGEVAQPDAFIADVMNDIVFQDNPGNSL